MKTIFIMILFFSISFAWAQDEDFAGEPSDVWYAGDFLYLMEKDPTSGHRLSLSCLEKKEGCAAYKVLKSNIRYQLNQKDLSGGKNPGAVICKLKLNGEVLILRDRRDNENSFCRFQDGSLLSSNALSKN